VSNLAVQGMSKRILQDCQITIVSVTPETESIRPEKRRSAWDREETCLHVVRQGARQREHAAEQKGVS